MKLFTHWNTTSKVPPRTKEDHVFFADLHAAAFVAEERFGPALREKYGARIPEPSRTTPANAEHIAHVLGARIIR